MMHRTHICLPETTYQAVKTLTSLEEATIADKLREFVQEDINKTFIKPKSKHYLESLGQLKFKGTPKDASINHDKYLYSNPHNL